MVPRHRGRNCVRLRRMRVVTTCMLFHHGATALLARSGSCCPAPAEWKATSAACVCYRACVRIYLMCTLWAQTREHKCWTSPVRCDISLDGHLGSSTAIRRQIRTGGLVPRCSMMLFRKQHRLFRSLHILWHACRFPCTWRSAPTIESVRKFWYSRRSPRQARYSSSRRVRSRAVRGWWKRSAVARRGRETKYEKFDLT